MLRFISKMLDSNTYIVTSMNTGSSPDVRNALCLLIISRRTERPLPATPISFVLFLWRYLSDRVKSSNRQIIDA